MLFNFFKKTCTQLKERGDRLFQEGSYAEARHAYEEAYSLIKPDSPSGIGEYLTDRIRSAGNNLALMNIEEAAHSLQSGNIAKAVEHAELAFEQAEDDVIRGNAKDFLKKIDLPTPPEETKKHCGSCATSDHPPSESTETSTDFLPLMERFELLIQPLPGDLTKRYRQMGERFAYAYTAVHDERLDEGYRIFRELALGLQSDILEYEIAIIDFQAHRLAECENRLKSALALNPENPLCHLAMVQLMLATDRLPNAAAILEHMIAAGHIADQALVMLGDVLIMMGDTDAGLSRYLEALEFPSVAKLAAQKAIPVLDASGRTADSQALAKRYLKGCC